VWVRLHRGQALATRLRAETRLGGASRRLKHLFAVATPQRGLPAGQPALAARPRPCAGSTASSPESGAAVTCSGDDSARSDITTATAGVSRLSCGWVAVGTGVASSCFGVAARESVRKMSARDGTGCTGGGSGAESRSASTISPVVASVGGVCSWASTGASSRQDKARSGGKRVSSAAACTGVESSEGRSGCTSGAVSCSCSRSELSGLTLHRGSPISGGASSATASGSRSGGYSCTSTGAGSISSEAANTGGWDLFMLNRRVNRLRRRCRRAGNIITLHAVLLIWRRLSGSFVRLI
jgi:hypothetical protein